MHTFVTDDGQHIYVNSGNCNFDVGFFVDEMSAALFKCSMCHLPAFDPVRASCSHLYCQECLLNLQQKTQNSMATNVRYHHILYTTTKQEEQEKIHLHSQHATYGMQCRNIFGTFQERV